VKPIRAGAAALNQTPLDWEGNFQRIVALLDRARSEGVSLLCLPELCITGYGCEDAFLGLGCLEQASSGLAALIPLTQGMVVCIGLPLLVGRGVYNTAALVVDGRLVGLAAKRFLAGDGIHYEPRWFKPWPQGFVGEVEFLDETYPVGDLVFEVGGVRLGFEICEDAWVAGRPGAELARAGVDVILNPSASHFAFGKLKVRESLVVEGSRAFGVAYLYANLLGNEAGRVIYDGGPMVAAQGQRLALGQRFSFADSDLAHAVIDVTANRMAQARLASAQPDLSDLGARLVKAEFTWPLAQPQALAPISEPDWEHSADLKHEEFLRAEALALIDYVRKSRAHGWVVSLSGGCDSTAVVALLATAVRLATQELGLQGLLLRLGHIITISDCTSEQALMTKLLTTVYQASENSGDTTRHAAFTVATAVGARHLEFDVAPLVQSYVDLVQQALGRDLNWQDDDLALQNIQARVRGPSVWLIANLENKLLLTTSNRSEAALGYATMDGDTCGGLAPLAGIDKAFLRQWLVWLETGGCNQLGAYPCLAVVTQQRSTPELRPALAQQFSEEDLMPFDVLDRIEKLAVRDKLDPTSVWERLRAERPETNPTVLSQWVSRFFTLFHRNQWKRERYAPSFHLDDENLDPKTWCRFPILSGGFTQELSQLRLACQKLRGAQ